MQLRFLEEAVGELEWEMLVLELEREGSGALFYREVEDRVALAARYPHLGQAVEGGLARQHVIKRFRCSVIVAPFEHEHVVVAIAPSLKEPGYWKSRVE